MALQPKVDRLTELEENYLDILVYEYQGYIPQGDHIAIAKRLGCRIDQLYALNSGKNSLFIAERDRRLALQTPLSEKSVRLAALQQLYENKIEARRASGKSLSAKDPLEILDQIRRESSTRNPSEASPTNVVFQFVQNLTDAQLSERMQQIEEALRTGKFVQEEEVVDGEWTESEGIRGLVAGNEDGGGETQLQESETAS